MWCQYVFKKIESINYHRLVQITVFQSSHTYCIIDFYMIYYNMYLCIMYFIILLLKLIRKKLYWLKNFHRDIWQKKKCHDKICFRIHCIYDTCNTHEAQIWKILNYSLQTNKLASCIIVEVWCYRCVPGIRVSVTFAGPTIKTQLDKFCDSY